MSTSRFRGLSQNGVAACLGAAAFAIFTTGTAVAVATTAVSITDSVSGVKAHVTGKQSLVTSERDPYSGTYARTDAAGKQLVGDGVGTLTVDGTVATHGVPLQAWAVFKQGTAIQNTQGFVDVTVPSTRALSVRTVSVRLSAPAGQNMTAALGYTERDGHQVYIEVPLVWQGNFSGEDIVVSTLTGLDLYPKAGTSIQLAAIRASNAGSNMQLSLTLLGQIM